MKGIDHLIYTVANLEVIAPHPAASVPYARELTELHIGHPQSGHAQFISMINKELFLREFMDVVWNKQGFEQVSQFVHSKYTIHLDTADPWEGKTLCHTEFKER